MSDIGPEIIIAAIIIGVSLPSGCSGAINNLADAVRVFTSRGT